MDNLFDYENDQGHAWERAEMLAEQAADLYENGRMAEALERLTEAIDEGMDNGAWAFNMALTMDGLERYDEAIGWYDKARQLLGDDVEVMNCLGVDYTRTGRYDRAIAIFEQIEQIDPMFEPGYCNRIITYTEMEQHQKAEQMFYLAQQIRSDCPLCFYNIGNSLFSRGLYERAAWCWEKTAELDPGHPQIQFRLAQAYWVGGRGGMAKEAFLREIRKKPADLDVLLEFGIFLLESGDLEGAKEKFNRICEFDPEFAAAHFYLGEVYRLRGMTEAAMRCYQQAMDGDGDMAGPRYRLAEMMIEQGKGQRAAELLKDEGQVEGLDIDVLLGMGAMFLRLGLADRAAHCFLLALEQEQEEPRAFRAMGMALAMRGELGGARQCLDQALRLHDEDVTTLLGAAWVCSRLEDWPAAVAYVDRSRLLNGSLEPYRTLSRDIRNETCLRRAAAFCRRLKNGRPFGVKTD